MKMVEYNFNNISSLADTLRWIKRYLPITYEPLQKELASIIFDQYPVARLNLTTGFRIQFDHRTLQDLWRLERAWSITKIDSGKLVILPPHDEDFSPRIALFYLQAFGAKVVDSYKHYSDVLEKGEAAPECIILNRVAP